MNWTDVKNRFDTDLGPSRSEQSDKRSLLVLARYSERHGINPDLFMAPRINALRAIVPTLRDAALDDDIAKMEELLIAAATLPMTDLRLKMGKQVEIIPTTRVGDIVTATFTREQYEKAAFRLRAYVKFA